jgi:N-acetylmannosamine-6-phosphate 2-epimerase / N-acetylmannosamine kinase
MSAMFEKIKGRLVVSCQASPGDPLEDADAIRRMALAAIGGGAVGLRVNSAEHIAALRRFTNVPIIGIHKHYGSAGLRITPDFAAARTLADAGASVIALDCTHRTWPDGEPWQSLVQKIHEQLRLPVMADVATFEEAVAAEAAGVDCVGPTLNGYTDDTRETQGFGWSLLARMSQRLHIPIMAEGHISTPAEARRAIDGGAWCVIVGSAITRPGVIARTFVQALERATPSSPAVGVDIGGTSIKAGLVSPDGAVSLAVQVPTDAAKGRPAITSGLIQAVEQVLAATRELNQEPAGIGIATAGAVDERDGSIFAATDNLPGWAGFPLRSFAQERFKLPAYVVNDAQAAVLSELHFGVGSGLTDFIAITIGTGIGGGIVSQGRLLRGQHGFSGSIGHTVIRADGRPCNCGRKGCLEAYVSTAALLHEYREHGGTLDAANNDAALALHVNQLARDGNDVAVKAYGALADSLAEGVANLFNLLDPQVVLLSGGLIEGYEPFLFDVQQRVEKLLHFGSKRQPQIRAAQAGRFAGVQGAAALAFEATR